jgi:LDH2 family malate/lactate/ureidoglycolate dehydrogenase
MAGYPESPSERRIHLEHLHGAVTRIFEASGMSPSDASLLAGTLAWADLRGIHSHGVLRVPDYVHKLTVGGVNPRGRPSVVTGNTAALVIDGGNSMGQIGSAFAMERAIERAQQTSVAVAVVRGGNHCGALAWYAMQTLPHGMIGIATTNALPTMAPWGGLDKIVGINPLAVALPGGEESPIVLDCAFSYSSHGKIRVFQQKGAAIPPTWAFDGEGHPTTDAAQAIEGLLQPIGEYKGAGLAIVFGLLSTALSGASYGTALGNMIDGAQAGHDGHFFLALNVAAFTSLDEFKSRIDAAVRQVRSSRSIGGQPVYAPGGLEAEIEVRFRRDGISLNSATIEGINRTAAELNVEGIG